MLTFEEVKDRVKSIASKNKDFYLKGSDMRANGNKIIINKEEYSIATHAQSQVCSKLEMPGAYMKKCAAQKPDLFSINFNAWLDSYANKDFLIRTTENDQKEIRAVLSDKYGVVDNSEIIDYIEPTVKTLEKDGLVFSSYKLTPDLFELDFRFPVKEVGDPISSGLSIINNETGKHAMSLNQFLFRLICENGAIRHISDFKSRYFHTTNLPSYISETMLYNMFDSVKTIGEKEQSKIIELSNTEFTIIDSIPNTLKLRLKAEDITNSGVAAVTSAYMQDGGDNTMYKYFNALTFAGTHSNIAEEEKLSLQKIAGKLFAA
jgi:hypothetical protein